MSIRPLQSPIFKSDKQVKESGMVKDTNTHSMHKRELVWDGEGRDEGGDERWEGRWLPWVLYLVAIAAGVCGARDLRWSQ